MSSLVNVRSEVGRLRRALVHEPGPEVDRMVPAMMEQLLFDDILYGDRARDEHGRFRRVLQHCGVELFDSSDLLEEALQDEEARRWTTNVVLDYLPRSAKDALQDRPAAELTAMLVGGERNPDADARAMDADELYRVTPLPNWCFQRDTQIVMGSGVMFSSMAAAARHREALLSRVIFRYHPVWKETPRLFDPLQPEQAQLYVAPERPHVEGGDVLVLSKDVIAVGLSERTNRSAIRAMARVLAKREDGPRWLFVVDVPRRRAYMHLDTLITPVDHDACLVYPPVILPGGREPARVWEVDLHSDDLARRPVGPLLESLAARGIDMEPIPCGGDDPVSQQREQWTDGSNALAVAPGLITLFDRNLATAQELDKRGFRVIGAEDLLLGRQEIDLDDPGRVCVLIPSHEISRARGGPHCLLHPLVRD